MKLKFDNIKLMWSHLTKREKSRLGYIFSLGFINALLETYSIFIVYLFMRVVQDPHIIDRYVKWLPSAINSKHCIVLIGSVAIIAYLIKGILNLLNNKTITHYSEKIQYRMSTNLYYHYLNMSYIDFIKENPPEVDSVIRGCVQRYAESILSIVGMMVDAVTILLIVVMLLMINWKLLLVVTVFFMLLGKIVLFFTVKESKKLGGLYSMYQGSCAKTVYNSMFNYKMLKLTGMNHELVEQFKSDMQKLGEINSKRVILNSLPRVWLEIACFVALIASIMIGVVITNDAEYVISLATLFLFVLMKILPSLMKMFYALQNLSFNLPFIEKIPFDGKIESEKLGDVLVLFESNIKLDNIGFWYAPDNKILHNISLEIRKGERVGIIGPSGVGKSTLQDIIIGLLAPKTGKILVDDIIVDASNLKQWRNKIGYIPQEIYLYNGTVAENIVLNREYNEQKLIYALKKAHIYDFLLEKEGINTLVGNNGVMLSGGQKQRIGIARALYTNPEILVLDEATSALDQATEASIMEDIYNESVGQTLIIITHRVSTLTKCNKIFTISTDGIQVKQI